VGAVSLDGSLTVGPTVPNQVPGGTVSFPVSTTPNPKTFAVSDSGVKKVASPGAAVSFGSLGASGAVTAGSFLYVKTTAAVSLSLTFGGTTVVLPLNGTLVMEFPTTSALTGLSVQGTATVEYFVSGDA
jgi:hypothetical protein